MEIYLDNSATTKPYSAVINYMNYCMNNCYGNPSSLHRKGIEAENLIKKAKKQIGNIIDASPSELFFTSGGTECNNLAIRGIALANRGKEIVSTVIEHPATLSTLKYMETEGYTVETVGVDNFGFVNPEEIQQKITNETVLVTIMHVNNEVGSIEPIKKISKIIKSVNPRTCLHVDASQSFCKIPFTVSELNCDLLTLSSHKLHGPKGVGCLYVRGGTKISPILFGGGQQKDLRPGTEDTFGIAGFGLASEISGNNIREKECKMRSVINKLRSLISKNIDRVVFNTPTENSAPHILNVSFEGIRSQVLLNALDKENIYVSSGSACSSHKNKPSYVLSSMGLSPDLIESSIRFSICTANVVEEMRYLVVKLKEIVPCLRRLR